MAPRHFWWLYNWKTRGEKKTRKGLTRDTRNRLLNWIEQENVTPPAQG